MNKFLTDFIDAHREDLIADVQRLLRIRSLVTDAQPGLPFGPRMDEALSCALEIAEKFGLETATADGYGGHAAWGEGEESLGVLVHLDVVPEGEGWSSPPYEAAIVDGRIIARGACDDKGPAIAALYALAAVCALGKNTKRRVRVIFGLSEESGDWSDILVHYRARFGMPEIGFAPDAGFPVINVEKGIVHIGVRAEGPPEGDIRSLRAGTRPNVVPELAIAELAIPAARAAAAAQAFCAATGESIDVSALDESSCRVCALGVSAHASTPDQGKNAALALLSFIDSLGLDGRGAMLVRSVCKALSGGYTGAGLGLKISDAVSGALTMNLGVLEMDGDALRLTLDIRHPVSFDAAYVLDRARQAFGDAFELGIEHCQKPLYVPEDHFLVQTLLRVYRDFTGDTLSGVMTTGGGTYARALPIGVAFGPGFPGAPDGGAHQKDESMSVEDLLLCAKIYAQAIYELACGAEEQE